jgi:hypothetical protein
MKIKEGGNEHLIGDRNRSSCESPAPVWFMLKSLPEDRRRLLVRMCSTACRIGVERP